MVRLIRWFTVFVLLASLCALPRFGQRENEYAPGVSDSDLYLEMARVFTGDKEAFTPAYVAWQPHHYNRPLLPWLAGHLAECLPGHNLRAAFSLLNILAAAWMALLLKMALERHAPAWRHTWLPPVLFLTGFPQLNWGYHLLTDTAGLATALTVALYATWLIRRVTGGRPCGWHLPGLLACSSAMFLTRETGWLAVITALWVAGWTWRTASVAGRLRSVAILLVLLAGALPHSLYEHSQGLRTPVLHVASLFRWNPSYWLDVAVKGGVCFHVVWFLVAGWLWRRWRSRERHGLADLPVWMVGWTLGSGLYMAAAYAHNDIAVIGYPMRIVYSLFPLVYYCVEELFESGAVRWRPHLLAAALCLGQFGIGLLGVYLDPGTPKVTAPSLFQADPGAGGASQPHAAH
jgi:hypothetical protein